MSLWLAARKAPPAAGVFQAGRSEIRENPTRYAAAVAAAIAAPFAVVPCAPVPFVAS